MNTILLTGCSGEIGSYLTKKLIKDNFKIIGIDKTKSKIKNKNFTFYQQDITNESEINELFKKFLKKKIKIDILINNAAISFFTPFIKRKKKEVMSTLDTNVFSTINFSNNYVKLFNHNKQSFGKIINIASVYGVISPDYRIYEKGDRINSEVYGASKASIIQLTKYYAVFLAKKNILVNCISPGGLKNKKKQKKKFIKKYTSKVPLGRMGELFDIFFTLKFLISKNNKYMTGQNLILDGGMSIW